MKIPKSVIEEDYEFWNKTYVQQTEIYLQYFLDHEVIDMPRYIKAPKGYQRMLKENCKKIFDLFSERYNPKDVVEFHPHNIAYAILYIASGVSHIGLTFSDLHTLTECNSKIKQIMDYLLNKIDILDWFKQTLEYKEWEEYQKWKEENPQYYKKPETDKEFGRVISIVHENQKSFRYSRDKLLSKIKR